MTVKGQKILAGVLGLVLFASVGLVSYTDSQRRKKESLPSSSLPTNLNPQAARGLKIYETFGCITCHGSGGKGQIKNNNAQTGGEVPPIDRVAESFSDAELRQKILDGVAQIEKLNPNGPAPPLAMPAYKNRLDNTDLEDLIVYIKSLMPSGEKTEW
jgi:mono/diheme cytochrome c family protein